MSKVDGHLKRILSHMADAVFIVNKSGIMVDCTVGYGAFTDLRKDRMTGLPIWDVFNCIRLEDSLFKHRMSIADLPRMHQVAKDEEKSIQTITRNDDDIVYTQAEYFVLNDEYEDFICIAIKDITSEYVQKYHLERNRVRLRMMVRQRTEEYDALNRELQKVNDALSEQIKEKVKARDELAEAVRAQALADSEKRFRHIVDKLQDMVTIVDEKNVITYVTPSCKTTYGYREDELVGQSVCSIVHPDDLSKVKAYTDSIRKNGELTDCICRIRRKDGEWADVKTVTVNMLDNPHIKGFVITYTDITRQLAAQRRIEYSLVRQQLLNRVMTPMQKSENISGAVNNAIAEVGRFANVSKVFIFEKSYDETSASMTCEWCNTRVAAQKNRLQQISVDLFNPWETDSSGGIIIRYPEMKNISPYLIETITTDDLKSFILLPLFADGKICGYLGFSEKQSNRRWTHEEESLLINFAQVISSVFQRQKSEKAQQLLQQALSTVLDNIPMQVYVADRENHEMLFANRAARDAGIDHANPQQNVTDTGGVCVSEHYDQQTDRWTHRISTPVIWIDERLVYLRTIEDITERKKMELELLNAKDHAEESDKLKSAFLANVSHEIRTPMGAVIGFSQLLSREVMSDEQQKYCGIISENCKVLLKLIDDIVDISKIEAEQMTVVSVPCNLNKFFDELKDHYRQQMQHLHKGKVELLFDDDMPPDTAVNTDSVRLRQILNNLIDNAVKFTDKGFVKVGCNIPGDGFIHFSVIDSGIGIPENQQQVIFERFRQLEQLRNLSGTGLGLAISKSLAQMLGGDMGVRSTVGEGSTFYFTISHEPSGND